MRARCRSSEVVTFPWPSSELLGGPIRRLGTESAEPAAYVAAIYSCKLREKDMPDDMYDPVNSPPAAACRARSPRSPSPSPSPIGRGSGMGRGRLGGPRPGRGPPSGDWHDATLAMNSDGTSHPLKEQSPGQLEQRSKIRVGRVSKQKGLRVTG